MLPSRWGHLIRYGLLGTAVVGGTARAEPCDQNGDQTIAAVIGVELSPRLRLIGGIEGRQCLSPKTDAVLRIEIGGGMRFMAGARVRPFEDGTDTEPELLGAEVGGSLDLDRQFAAYLAASFGDRPAYGALRALIPLADDQAPSRIGLLLGLVSQGGHDPMVVNGRALRTGGAMIVPAVLGTAAARGAEARAVRDHFAGAAQLEFSSVWTFLRLARELAAVGAPARLVALALDAADDEIRHAELCSGAAGGVALAGLPDAIADARFTQRSDRALATLASEAWLDGCLNEAAASAEARFAATLACEPIAAMLASIATDEARHAELSWAVVEWVTSVAPGVARAAMRSTPPRDVSPRGYDRALARHGVPGPEVTAAALAEADAAAGARRAALV